jgi:hypothetical protein
MAFFNYDLFDVTPLVRDPFAYVVVPHFIRREHIANIASDFPIVAGAGSFPSESLELRGSFRGLLHELDGDVFRTAVERKFEVDLADHPKVLTVRGHARQKDGAIHTDTASKFISVLLYLNEEWGAEGGRLRLLRSPNLHDSAIEIPPVAGTLVAFKRSGQSWHGHRPYTGPRRVIQLNWMTTLEAAHNEHKRHAATAIVKKLAGFLSRRWLYSAA